ncbi:signal transduction histidine kinase [Algoriphagus ratkowskyi]|uniref:histidine kinase n=1 Tax=Algoriphagus ratkowskyi TaxID=57028 RepID=A0A2W7S3E2_9BACT|nr:HAMP domain-containing sensor histidine kinase [Algoriphagus ratkowskyi]PZX57615.1 signal transduction histidine kinase [Algoriphagus ratkowskyi]TXD78889.1 HAMP domain-containing histidine kinase [Algoriphagus ratkowskyi]
MTRLLDKPFKAFTIYALVILLVSIPIYFLVVDWIWVTEIDDHHEMTVERIENRFKEAHLSGHDLEAILNSWNMLQPSSSIMPITENIARPDSIYEVTKYNEYELESDRFRGLQTVIEIDKKPYLLNIETNVEEAYETIFAIGLVTVLLYGLLVFGFIQLNRKISKSVWEPFDNTLTKLKSFDLSLSKGVEFDETDIEEFTELNQTITRLVAENVNAYNQQKAFVANASHELQTPIALLKSKLDILFQDEKLSAKQSELVNAIQIPLARLTRVNKNLLLLARIDNSKFSDSSEIDFLEKIEKSEELLQDYISERKLTYNKEITGIANVNCSLFLAETLVNNLLSNAIRHSLVSGEIIVRIGENEISFLNSGVERLKEETLFKRFSISTTDTTNSGLGLAIVKEICKQNGWEINYDFLDHFHIFSVRFSKF